MEMALAGWGKIDNYQEEIANANFSNIRILKVDRAMSTKTNDTFLSDGWQECSSESIAEFSAVAYFFGRHLGEKLDVPIGLIQSAWGGTVVEAWTSGGSLKQIPEFTDIVAKLEIDLGSNEANDDSIKKLMNKWPDEIEKLLTKSDYYKKGFQNANFPSNKLKKMNLPVVWEDTGLEVDGVVWFTKSVNIPKDWDNKDLILSLGRINDFDITWFNGKKVGRGINATDLREYKIPSSLVKVGINKIVVQVLDIGNVGGIYGPAEKMKISTLNKTISLTGDWNYLIDPVKLKVPPMPKMNLGPNRPTVLYNGMINPLLPYGIRGAIWYQGESNAERAYQYRTLFKTLINDWRTAWNQGNFPFLFVQLANFKRIIDQPVDDAWAELREAQSMALELENTGMAVAIDIGDAIDIHPKNKQDVGKRLALNAIAKVYDHDIAFSGPVYQSMNISGNKVRLKFTNTNDGLRIKNSNVLKGFAIAGQDQKFRWAKAKIEGNEVVVWNSKIKNPVAVRYAWASNPVCNLYNGADLPASPFRTDDWKGITFGKK